MLAAGRDAGEAAARSLAGSMRAGALDSRNSALENLKSSLDQEKRAGGGQQPPSERAR